VLEIKRSAIQRKLSEDVGFSARFHRALAVFLADRLRAANRRLGYGKQGDLGSDHMMEGELDMTVLDTVSQAGDRFNRLLGDAGGGVTVDRELTFTTLIRFRRRQINYKLRCKNALYCVMRGTGIPMSVKVRQRY
jgi:hypothetical protein